MRQSWVLLKEDLNIGVDYAFYVFSIPSYIFF